MIHRISHWSRATCRSLEQLLVIFSNTDSKSQSSDIFKINDIKINNKRRWDCKTVVQSHINEVIASRAPRAVAPSDRAGPATLDQRGRRAASSRPRYAAAQVVVDSQYCEYLHCLYISKRNGFLLDPRPDIFQLPLLLNFFLP